MVLPTDGHFQMFRLVFRCTHLGSYSLSALAELRTNLSEKVLSLEQKAFYECVESHRVTLPIHLDSCTSSMIAQQGYDHVESDKLQ